MFSPAFGFIFLSAIFREVNDIIPNKFLQYLPKVFLSDCAERVVKVRHVAQGCLNVRHAGLFKKIDHWLGTYMGLIVMAIVIIY